MQISKIEELPQEVAQDLVVLVNSLRGIEKTSRVVYETKNGKTDFWYTPLEELFDRIKTNNNFAIIQPIGTDELTGKTGIKTIFIHRSGYLIESGYYPISDFQRMQDAGAEITYKKRYALAAALGISTEEDTDGNDEKGTYAGNKNETPKEAKLATESQKNFIKRLYGEQAENEVEKIGLTMATLTIKAASELIEKGKAYN